MKICSIVGARFASLNRGAGDFGWGLSMGACEINGVNKKNLLAMAIHSDMKAGGVSLGTISRTYEGVGNPSVYSYFERLLRPGLRGDGLPF